MLITLEGIEGSGKTTQIKTITDFLNTLGVSYFKNREPGGTNIGGKIRSILLDIDNKGMDLAAELFLCLADRIHPAIEHGMVVICDRYVDSTIVYQGFARGLDISIIKSLHKTMCMGLMPDITFLMDIDPMLGLLRTRKRLIKLGKTNQIRFEEEDINFHKTIRHGYLKLAKIEPERFYLIDASLNEEQVKAQIEFIIKQQLL